jgi:S1-C subfamily serine protease
MMRERPLGTDDDLKSYGRSVGRLRVIFLNYTVTEPWKTGPAEEATGSCWFIRLPGESEDVPPRYMMTCNHCVQRSMEYHGVHVQIPHAGAERLPARLVIAIPEIDGAVLELTETDGIDASRFRALELGDDAALRTGDTVQVYGYPMNQDKLKVSESKITGREDGLIVLDGSINYGHSGGPVVRDGRVVGWITMGMPQANAISFAQPISYLKAVMSALRPPARGARILRKGSLGIKYFNGSEDRLISLGARTETCDEDHPCRCESGVVIQWASRYSDLKKDPVRAMPGDVICSIVVPLEVRGRVREHRLRLDNTGQVTVPWMEDKVDLSVVLTLVPIGMPIGVDVWKSKERRLVSTAANLKNTYVNGYFSPYYPYERTVYEIFAGIIVAEMNADVLSEFPKLALCLSSDEKEEPRLVAVKVYLGSPLDSSRNGSAANITEGSVIRSVNGREVRNIEQYRDALRRPFEGRFLSIVTDKDRGEVVNMNKVLEAEGHLAEQYGYPISDTYRYFRGSPAGGGEIKTVMT